MDIDFGNLTDEMKAELKKNLEKIEDATGVVAFDPSKPMSRAAMEQIKITQKIAGKDEELTVYEAAQRAAKAGGADAALRESSEAKAFKKAFDEFKTKTEAGEIPDDRILAIVAPALNVDVATLKASITAEAGSDDTKKTTKASAAAAVDEEAITKKVIESLTKQGLLLPNKYAGDFLRDGMDLEGQKVLKDEVDKALAKDGRLTALLKKAEENPQHKGLLEKLSKGIPSTVQKLTRGRLAEIREAGTGNIVEEIPGIVADVVKDIDYDGILAMAAPQPIIMGGGESGDLDIKILSNEKPKDDLSTDDPDYLNNEVKIYAQRLAKEHAETTGA